MEIIKRSIVLPEWEVLCGDTRCELFLMEYCEMQTEPAAASANIASSRIAMIIAATCPEMTSPFSEHKNKSMDEGPTSHSYMKYLLLIVYTFLYVYNLYCHWYYRLRILAYKQLRGWEAKWPNIECWKIFIVPLNVIKKNWVYPCTKCEMIANLKQYFYRE